MVQYAVLTTRQNSSECLPVDGAVLRGLLVHVAFDGTLGFPGEGPPKRYVCPVSSAALTDTKGPLAAPGAGSVPDAGRRMPIRLVTNGNAGPCACCCCSCA